MDLRGRDGHSSDRRWRRRSKKLKGDGNGRSFVEMAVGSVGIGSVDSLSADETKSVCMPV